MVNVLSHLFVLLVHWFVQLVRLAQWDMHDLWYGFFAGMTMVKLSKNEESGAPFIERRRAGLERQVVCVGVGAHAICGVVCDIHLVGRCVRFFPPHLVHEGSSTVWPSIPS